MHINESIVSPQLSLLVDVTLWALISANFKIFLHRKYRGCIGLNISFVGILRQFTLNYFCDQENLYFTIGLQILLFPKFMLSFSLILCYF